MKNANGEVVEIEERAASANAAYGAAANLRRTKTYYASTETDARAGRLRTEQHPDGRLDSYDYQRDANNFLITTHTRGVVEAPAGVANKTTREVWTLDAMGNEIERKAYLYNGIDYALVQTDLKSFDDEGRQLSHSRNGRLLESATYANSKRVSHTDEQGITTLFTYDSRDRVRTRTKVGVAGQPDQVTTFSYDPEDHILEKLVTAGDLSTREQWTYDLAGRMTSHTNAAGYLTTYTYANGGRTITRTNPDTSVVVTQKHLDGQIKSVTGNGVVDAYHSYSLAANGHITTRTDIGYSNSARFTQSTQDVLGRLVEQRQPGFGGQHVLRTFQFDNRGLLIKETETELADTLHVYDAARQRFRSGLDLDQNGQLTLASSDRITEEEAYFWQGPANHWWRTLQARVYPEAQSALPTVVSEQRTRLNGFEPQQASEIVTLDTQGNQSSQSTTIDRSAVTTTITTDVPDSSLDGVETYLNGLLQTRSTPTISQPTLYTYDALSRKISQKSPRHSAPAQWEFHPQTGLLISHSDADGHQTTYAYHPQGQLGAGQVASTTDALGQVSYRGYNTRAQLTRIWGATEYPVEYAYNDFGERINQTTFRSGDEQNLWTGSSWPSAPPAGDLTAWSYDQATGLLTAKTDAQAASVTYSYTTAGRLAERFWARLDAQSNPLKTSYTYAPLTGERTRVDYADNTADIDYEFDRMGRLQSVSDGSGTRTFQYNADLQLHKESIPFYGADKQLVRHYQTGIPGTQVVGRYRGFSAGTSAQPAADYTVDYSFDNQGRLQNVIDPQSTYQYTYVSQSHLVAAITSPAHTTTYTYEANRDLKVQVQNDSAATYQYGYDAIRRRTHRLRSGSLFAQNSFDTFQYNTRSEVIASDRYLGDDPSDTSTPTLNEAFAYQFDAIGNRLQATAAGITESYTSNELNQYQTIGAQTRTYDADGNLTSDGQRHYDWTAENRLKSIRPIVPYPEAQRIDYQYDYLGRRIQKTVSQWNGDQYALISDQKFLYDEWNLVATYDATANNTRTTTHTWGLDLSGSLQGAGGVGGLLSTQEHQGAHAGLYHYACDANGNVTEIFDQSGAIAAHYQYDPFGNTIASIGSYADTNKFRFSTKYWDEESELYYYGYRYYDPATGRWSNRDPIQEQGGLNLYAMVQNNPIGYWDYLGMSNCGESWWDNLTEKAENLVNETVESIKEGFEALERAVDIEKIQELSDKAFANEDTDAFAHERSAYEYGEHVDNAFIAGAMRTAGEIGQFIGYGAETIADAAGVELDILPGDYNPFSSDYLADAAFDVSVTVAGAKGADFNESIKR